MLIAWPSSEGGVTWGGNQRRFHWTAAAAADSETDSTGDDRLRLIGGGWEFENSHLRARIARTGALTGLWRKQAGGWRQVLRHGSTYTDRGFREAVRYAQENDVEASIRVEWHGSDIRLSVCGQMRGFGRFDKMAHPVRFYNSDTFGDGPAFRYACAVKTENVSTASYAFLSLRLRTDGVKSVAFADADGQFLTGQRNDGSGRFAQLAQSAAPQRLPTDIRLSGADGVMLWLGDMAWSGARPDNVFMHGDDLHLAWMDGKPDNRMVGQWRGLTRSVACEDTLAAGADPLPLVLDRRFERLRNGGFEASDSSDVILLSSGQTLLRSGGRHDAWAMPPGAEYAVEDGNRCVTVESDGQSYRLIRQAMPVQTLETGSKWRLSARLKGLGVEPGDVNWNTACLRRSVSAGGRTTYATASLPSGNSPWQTWEVLLTVPEKAESVTVEAGLNGNRGQVWIDDVRMEKAGAPSR